MPLKSDEIAAIAPEAMELAKALSEAFGPDSDGGKKLTKAELGGIAKKALGFGWKLIRDIMD